MKMKIGIDIDEVVVEFLKGYLKICENKLGKTFFVEGFHSYLFEEHLGITREDSLKIANEFYGSKQFENLEFVEGAKSSIYELSKENELFIITSRPLHIKEKTRIFFTNHFPDIDLEIIHSNDLFGDGKSKAEICEEKGVKILIVFDCFHFFQII